MRHAGDGLGWDDPDTAAAYAHFARRHAMYRDTSADLVALAGVQGDTTVVDLACGTGVTTAAILERLGDGGRVLAVDSSPAMLGEARTSIDDRRVEWIERAAEQLADVVDAADTVVCNSAIWQTRMPQTFSAIATVLRPGGRFACNIGRQFLPMPFTEEELHPPGPGLFDLVRAYAVIDHRMVTPPPGASSRRGPLLSEEVVRSWLEDTGLVVEQCVERAYGDTLERLRDWLSIPIFGEQLLPGLTAEQRADALAKAYAAADPATVLPARWMVFVASKP